MNFSFQSQSPDQESRTGDPDKGLLWVAVPHWATELKIYDNSLEPVTGIGKIESEAPGESGDNAAGVYRSEISLKPGMYQVEASLEGKTESIWVPVKSGHITQIPQDAWKGLEFTSSAPLEETANSDNKHIKAAENWSRESTSKDAGKGNSSLFLFMHTSEPKRFRETFTTGLQLFSETGELITDFSSGVKTNETQGWMAYQAKMKSGGYILRRGRPGVRLRYQLIYLCDNWQTQVFIASGRYPSLRTLSYNMTPVGTGNEDELPAFQTDDKTALAAEAILNFLRYDSGSQSLFNNERMDILLDDKTENPWLGILAAYAIAKLKEDVKPEEQTGYQEYFTLLDEKILPFLARKIPMHPDVRALLLKDDQSVDLPFSFPPMLWRSLKKVYNHGNLHENTVPAGSLTDCLRENVLGNSPWVAWRKLDRMPAFNWSEKSNSLFAVDKMTAVPGTFAVPLSPIPKIPVFRLPDFEQNVAGDPSRGTATARAAQTGEALVQEISVIQKAKEVVKDYVLTGKLDELPDTLPMDHSDEINKLLKGLTAENVSQWSHLSLSEAHEAIEQLRSHGLSAQSDPAAASQPEKLQDITAQQTVARVACAQFDRAAPEDFPGLTGDVYGPTVKELIGDLRTEAQRIFLRADQIEGVQAGKVREVVTRMNAVATELLKRADFVLITDPTGKIVYCNGAFIQLISSPDESSKILRPEETSAWQESRAKQAAGVLANIRLGANEVSNKELPEGFRNWEVRRVQVEAGAESGAETGAGILYIDILRLKDFSSLTEEQLRGINTVISLLTNFTSLLAYGSKENMGEYLTGVEETLGKLEQAVADTGTAKRDG